MRHDTLFVKPGDGLVQSSTALLAVALHVPGSPQASGRYHRRAYAPLFCPIRPYLATYRSMSTWYCMQEYDIDPIHHSSISLA